MKRALSVLLVCSIALAAAAGERLPYGFLAHASAKSLASALAGFDAFAAACAKDTPAAGNLQPGMMSVAVRMTIAKQLPPNAWDSEAEIHVVAALAQPDVPNPVVILKIPGMAAFKKAMNDNGAKLAGNGQTVSGQIPGLPHTWHFTDVGGGRMACSPDPATLDLVVKALASGWSPKHRAGADVSVNLEKNILAGFRATCEQFMDELNQMSGDALTSAARRVVAKIHAALVAETPALDNIEIDLSFNKDRLKTTLSLSGDKGSGIDNLRAAYAGGAEPKYALANTFPEETVLLSGVADLARLPEGWREFYGEALRELADGVMPERADRLAGLARRFFDLGIRDWTTGSYLVGDRLVVATYFRHGGAKEIEAFLGEAAELGEVFLNNLAGMLGGDNAPSFAIDYQPKAGKLGNVQYQRVTFRVAPPGGGREESCDFLFALGAKTVAGVFGQVDEGDLRKAIDNHQRPSGGFADSEAVKMAMAEPANRQIKIMATRPLAAAADLVVFGSTMKGDNTRAMREVAAELGASRSCLVMAAGATDRALTFECVIPAELIGDCVRYSDALNRMRDAVDSARAESLPAQRDEDELVDDEEEDWEEDWDTSSPGREDPPAKTGTGIDSPGKPGKAGGGISGKGKTVSPGK